MVLEILPLALLSAVYPTLLAAVLLILSRPHPRRLLAGYLVGGLLMSMVAGMAVIALLREGNLIDSEHHGASPIIDFAIAGVALLLLWLLLTDRDQRLRERRAERRKAKEAGHPGARKPSISERLLERDSVRMAFFIGIALNLPGATYLVALKDIAETSLGNAETVAALLLFNVIMFLWAEIPLIGYGIAPERTRRLIEAMSRWLHAHSRQISIVICAAAAIYLIALGVADS